MNRFGKLLAIDGNVENVCRNRMALILFNWVILLSNLILGNANHTIII
tara:strand:+ start:433 stop:576 length:144 start_codon:yes stop_codon:yes gene_type:complete